MNDLTMGLLLAFVFALIVLIMGLGIIWLFFEGVADSRGE